MSSRPLQTSFESQTDEEEFQVLDLDKSTHSDARSNTKSNQLCRIIRNQTTVQASLKNCEHCLDKSKQVEVPQKESIQEILKLKDLGHCSSCHQTIVTLTNHLSKLFFQKKHLQKILVEKNTQVKGLTSLTEEHKIQNQKIIGKNKQLQQRIDQFKARKQKQAQDRSNQIINFYQQKLQNSLQQIQTKSNQLSQILNALKQSGVSISKEEDIAQFLSDYFVNKQNNSNVTDKKIFNIFKLTGRQYGNLKKLSNDYFLNEIEISLKSMVEESLKLKKEKSVLQEKILKFEKAQSSKDSFKNSATMENLVNRKNHKN